MAIFLPESIVQEKEADAVCRLNICLSEITINGILMEMYIDNHFHLKFESLDEGFADMIRNLWKKFKDFCKKIFNKIKELFSNIRKKIRDLFHKKKSTKQEKKETEEKMKNIEKIEDKSKSKSSGPKKDDIKKEKEKMKETIKDMDKQSKKSEPESKSKAKCYKLDMLQLGLTFISPNPFSMRKEQKRGMISDKNIKKLEDALKEILDAEKEVGSYGFDSFKKSKENLKNPLWIIQNTAQVLADSEDDIMEDIEYTKSQEFIDNVLYSLVENIPAEIFKASPIRDCDDITADGIVQNLISFVEEIENPTDEDVITYGKQKDMVVKTINTGRERLDQFLKNMESFEKELDQKQKNILSMIDKVASIKIDSYGGETDQSKIQKMFSEVIEKLKKYVSLIAKETVAEYSSIVKAYATIGTSFNKIEQYLTGKGII